ncbi:hypothetical protein V8B97DRAFT_796444 [Scleroderma yunnanense]
MTSVSSGAEGTTWDGCSCSPLPYVQSLADPSVLSATVSFEQYDCNAEVLTTAGYDVPQNFPSEFPVYTTNYLDGLRLAGQRRTLSLPCAVASTPTHTLKTAHWKPHSHIAVDNAIHPERFGEHSETSILPNPSTPFQPHASISPPLLIPWDQNDTPASSRGMGNSCMCGWKDENNDRCMAMMTEDNLREHLADHGIKNMAGDIRVNCRICDPPRPMKRENVLRHCKEVHLKQKRRPSTRKTI